MDGSTYYIMTENIDGQYSCIKSHKDIEKTKQHAKMISGQLNMITLIVKPVVKLIPNTEWIVKDLN